MLNKLKKLAYPMIIIAIAAATACGGPAASGAGNNAPPTVVPAPQDQSEGSQSTPLTMPTTTARIPGILEQAQAEQAAAETNSADTAADNTAPQQANGQPRQQQPGNTGQTEQTRPAITLDPASMPGELSEVQLADIYAGMNLEQFAITPEQWEAILGPQSTRYPGKMEGLGMPVLTPEQRNSHPYNHMIQPSPAGNDGNPDKKESYNQNIRTSMDITIGPRAFLEYPFSTPFYEYQDSLTGLGLPYEFDKYVDTVTFGRNSTKHVLAEAIAQAMEPMIMDGVEPFPIAYQSKSPEDALIILERDDLAATQDLREYLNRSGASYEAYFHQPISYWEFIHPTLPIVRVIVEGNSGMPFARPGEIPGYVAYQVGFVMTFQNRWQSFDDPNRWLTRFRNTTVGRDLKIDEDEEGIATPWRSSPTWMDPQQDIASEAEHGHRFWHHTDYMQHRIVGPVWVKVVQSDIMEKGRTASITPRINHWAAPGPIVPNEHLMTQLVRTTENDRSWAGYEHLKLRPAAGSPNPGFPLPYHVTATGHHPIRTQYHNPIGTYDRHALPGGRVWAEYCQHQYFRDAFNCPP